MMASLDSVQRQPPRLTRRAALRLVGDVGATALLAACGSTGGSPTPTATTAPTRAATPTQAPSAAVSPSGAEIGAIVSPNTGAKLPTEKVTFRWIDSGDLKALFYKKYFAAYQEAHSNITITYDALPWSEIQKIVPLGVQNGNAHDTFALPPNVPAGQAVREGWVAPLDDIVPNFEAWRGRFPFGAFIEGVHVFNGKTYTYPVTSSKRYGTLLLYNTEYLQQAGYDPQGKPLTWDEFRAAAKKLTQQGKGQYYGFIIGGKDTQQWSGRVSNLARMAGASAGGVGVASEINWKTGEFNYTSDEYLGAIDLLLGLKSDNSVFPGSLSLNGPDARSRMPHGVAGMILEGPWNIPQWPRENPSFKFGVASQPIPNSGKPLPMTYEETGSNLQWVYARSPLKPIAGDMFSYIGSEAGQVAIVVATQGNLQAVFPKSAQTAMQSQELDPHARQALDLFEQQVRLGPMPQVRNSDESQVVLELKRLQPDFGEVVQGLYTGQLTDPKAAMQDLKNRSEKELDRAIKAARDKGAQVSRDDYVFTNWDPTKDYTKDDYDALKK